MQEDVAVEFSKEASWLFSPRLQFMDAPQSIRSRISDPSLLEQFKNCRKKECPLLGQPITSNSQLQGTLDLFNALILDCRFNEDNVAASLSKSRNEMKTKKQIKDVEKQSKNKIRKLMEMEGWREEEEEEQHWRGVLNHKNIIEHLHKAYLLFGQLISLNFDLIDQGVAHLRDQNLPKILQIKICILAIDAIILLNRIRFAFLPHFLEQEKTSASSKLELQERKLLDEGLQSIQYPPNFPEEYQKLKGLKISTFFLTIERISSDLKGSNPFIEIWVDTFKIKKSYLIDEEGLWKRKFDGKLETTCVKEICLYWMQINNQHLRYLPSISRKAIPFEWLFREYRYLFSFIGEEAIKSPERMEDVLNYLYLVEGVWLEIDRAEASRLFWKELSFFSNRIDLPEDFLIKNKQTILEIGRNIVDDKNRRHNSHYLLKAKQFVLSLSRELVSLDYRSDLVNDFILKQLKNLRLLLTEWSVFNEEVKKVRNLLDDCKDAKILSLVKEVTAELEVKINSHNFCMNYLEQERTISDLLETFHHDQDTVFQLKHFLLLGRNFQDKPLTSSLEACCHFYRTKREAFQLNLGKKPVGIVDSVRLATFEFISSIKLEKENLHSSREEKALQQKVEKLIFKLLRIYKLKLQMKRREDDLEESEEKEEEAPYPPLFSRTSSYDVDPNHFQIQQSEAVAVYEDSPTQDDGFTMNLLKKLLELKLQVVHKKIEQLDIQEKPLKQEYQDIKSRVYMFAGGQSKDQEMTEDIQQLAEIEYKFLRKRYYQGWRKLRQLRTPIEGIIEILQNAWGGKNCILKLYAKIYQRYKAHQLVTQHQNNAGQLKEAQIEAMIAECLEPRDKSLLSHETIKNLKRAVKILQNLELVSVLKKQRDEQLEKLETLEEAKNYRSEKEQLKFKELEGKVEICSIFKNDILIMKRYSILRVEVKEFDELLKKVKKLIRFHRSITLKPDKLRGSIIIQVDEQPTSFESYPKLIKHLIQLYLETIQFCQRELSFELYPLVLHRHIRMGKKHDNHISLRFYPFEGMLLCMLLDFKDLKMSRIYRYPQYPFIEFADQLNCLLLKGRDRVQDCHKTQSQSYAFKHLVEEMKAISMETEGNREIVKRILKCPYFWSSTDKLFELVQFKERYQSNINIQQSRRKENERVRSELSHQELGNFNPDQRHPLYKTASGYNKTTQFYFSIEGLIEKQAFEEDIGNFGASYEQDYKYHAYWWIKDKSQIERLIEMVSERERRRGCKKSNVYEKTFNSFQNQIRNLRNISVHYIYDDLKKREIDFQEKLGIFEMYFPKLFVFLYRWRPFLGKDYINEIKVQKVKFLKEVFNKEDPREVFKRLESIDDLSKYNLKNINGYLMKLFGYDFARVYSCEPCKILCNSLSKQESLWAFLQDIKRVKVKEGKDMTYNLLFWEHEAKGCNGMKSIEKAFYNVKQRNQFTTEEFSLGKSSIVLMKVEKQRLEKQIKREEARLARKIKNGNLKEEEEGSQSEERDSDAKNKESGDRRLFKISANEREEIYEEMTVTDYVCKYFIYELQMKLPYLFHDLRRFRYRWDDRASQFPQPKY